MYHISQGNRIFKIATPVFHAHLLRHRNLDIIDVITVPQRFKQRISKTEGQDILYRFLTEVMVYAVYLLLLECPPQQLVKRYGRLLVVTERFLDNNPVRPRYIGKLVFVNIRGRRFDELGCNGKVKKSVGPRTPLFIDRKSVV